MSGIVLKIAVCFASTLLLASVVTDENPHSLIEKRHGESKFGFRALALETFFTEDIMPKSIAGFIPEDLSSSGWSILGKPEVRTHIVHGEDDIGADDREIQPTLETKRIQTIRVDGSIGVVSTIESVSYTHLTLPTKA